MQDTSTILVETGGPIARVTLNRPGAHNAFNADIIAILTESFKAISDDRTTRAVILSGNGKSFSAGADLTAMKALGSMSREENIADAQLLSQMLATLSGCTKPVIAVVHGSVMGGGVGLTACADIALAAEDTKFALSEVKLGLTPATISPYVVQAIGLRWARRLFTTAELFLADRARDIGLVHDVFPDKETALLEAEHLAGLIARNGPEAVAAAKDLAFYVSAATGQVTPDMRHETAERIAARRASPEGQEGMNAFFEKRNANWIAED